MNSNCAGYTSLNWPKTMEWIIQITHLGSFYCSTITKRYSHPKGSTQSITLKVQLFKMFFICTSFVCWVIRLIFIWILILAIKLIPFFHSWGTQTILLCHVLIQSVVRGDFDWRPCAAWCVLVPSAYLRSDSYCSFTELSHFWPPHV